MSNEEIRVVIADDEPGMRMIMRKMIEKAGGFTLCGEADNGPDLLKLVERYKPQVCFLDVEMPGMTGLECAKAIQDTDPRTILVFATAHEDYMAQAFEVYAFDYMVKPFKGERVMKTLERIRQVIGGRAQPQSEQAEKLEEKLRKNRLTLTDYLDQMEQLQNMGDLSQIAGMLPGNLGKQLDASQIDEKQMAHTKAIILSMTPLERENPQILNASRKKRIAAGCGLEVVDVNRLLKSFEMLQQMTKAMTKGKLRGLGGMMGGMPNMNRMHGFGRKKRLK